MMMVPTKILPLLTTGLLSWGTKLRMGMELLRAPKPQAGRRIGGRVHRGALRRRGGGLSGRAAAFRNLRRQPARAERHQRAAALRRAGQPVRQPDARRAGGARQSRQNRQRRRRRRCSARSRAGWARWSTRSRRPSAARSEVRQGRAQTVERTASGFRIQHGRRLAGGRPPGGGVRSAQRLGAAARRGRAAGGAAGPRCPTAPR